MPSDALVIGAGVNGLFSALLLARQGLTVSLVDRGGVALESTWAGAGILSPLLPWDYGHEVNALSERARALWPGWVEQLAQVSLTDPEFRVCGMLALGVDDRADAIEWCRSHGWHAESLPVSPLEGHGGGKDALWLPDVAQVRNPRLAKALTEACIHEGVHILTDTPVKALDIADGAVRSVMTSTGELSAKAYVITSGAWSQGLLGEWAGGTDIHPVRGQILLFKGPPGLLSHIIYEAGHYLVPRQDGLILAGSTLELADFEKTVTQTARDELMDFSLTCVPELNAAELVQHWSGIRPGSPGNIPTISAHPDIGNLYLNSGHFRYGVTMAPASAELLSDIMLGHTPCIDPEPYRWRSTKLDVV
jgi:glycine oxidase